MIAVTTFRAYALSRPDGWPAGWYDGTFGEDGLRLVRGGREWLHVPPGTPGVTPSGAALTLPVAGTSLTVELSPPAPADPRATAVGFALYLTGGTGDRRRVTRGLAAPPVGLQLLAVVPLLVGLLALPWVGFGTRVVGSVWTAVNVLVLLRSGWSVADRGRVLAGSAVGAVVVAGVAVAISLLGRLARPGM